MTANPPSDRNTVIKPKPEFEFPQDIWKEIISYSPEFTQVYHIRNLFNTIPQETTTNDFLINIPKKAGLSVFIQCLHSCPGHIDCMTVLQLKQELRQRGMKLSGNKESLYMRFWPEWLKETRKEYLLSEFEGLYTSTLEDILRNIIPRSGIRIYEISKIMDPYINNYKARWEMYKYSRQREVMIDDELLDDEECLHYNYFIYKADEIKDRIVETAVARFEVILEMGEELADFWAPSVSPNVLHIRLLDIYWDYRNFICDASERIYDRPIGEWEQAKRPLSFVSGCQNLIRYYSSSATYVDDSGDEEAGI
tara:strand:- start:10286 stop:11212 length:927 start_codon:yes stop_codon:yes gene_type:complete